MVTLEWDLDRTDGVTLVRVYVAAQRARRVRVENRLDGPVWPPRSRGQPEAGWDDDGFEGVVAPTDRLVCGYATPAPPEEPPVELAVEEPADGRADGSSATTAGIWDTTVPTVESTPADVVRTLGNPVVPRDAVPVPDSDPDPEATSPERVDPANRTDRRSRDR